jgi:hypothetical protein
MYINMFLEDMLASVLRHTEIKNLEQSEEEAYEENIRNGKEI